MLTPVGQLYAIERKAKDLSDDARLALRQARSLPTLEKIKDWLDAEQEVVLPRSPTATAISYAQNQWDALTTYATQGYLNIDNNASERALKRARRPHFLALHWATPSSIHEFNNRGIQRGASTSVSKEPESGILSGQGSFFGFAARELACGKTITAC